MAGHSEVRLAIEGGGSTGRAALAWGGVTAARRLPGGLNPNDIEPDLLRQRLESLVLPLLDLPGRPIGTLLALAAIAGAGRMDAHRQFRLVLEGILRPRSRRLRLKVSSDAEALLQCLFAGQDGIVLIAGTGSVCFGVKRAGGRQTRARAGGWGSYLDDAGGFRLGLWVLETALKALDGRRDRTPSVDLLCRRQGLGLDKVPDGFLPMRREQVADLARIALEAARQGDAAARLAVRETVTGLVEMACAVAAELGFEGPFDLAVSGGLLEHPQVLTSFKRALRRRLPYALLIRVNDPLACLIGRMG